MEQSRHIAAAGRRSGFGTRCGLARRDGPAIVREVLGGCGDVERVGVSLLRGRNQRTLREQRHGAGGLEAVILSRVGDDSFLVNHGLQCLAEVQLLEDRHHRGVVVVDREVVDAVQIPRRHSVVGTEWIWPWLIWCGVGRTRGAQILRGNIAHIYGAGTAQDIELGGVRRERHLNEFLQGGLHRSGVLGARVKGDVPVGIETLEHPGAVNNLPQRVRCVGRQILGCGHQIGVNGCTACLIRGTLALGRGTGHSPGRGIGVI